MTRKKTDPVAKAYYNGLPTGRKGLCLLKKISTVWLNLTPLGHVKQADNNLVAMHNALDYKQMAIVKQNMHSKLNMHFRAHMLRALTPTTLASTCSSERHLRNPGNVSV